MAVRNLFGWSLLFSTLGWLFWPVAAFASPPPPLRELTSQDPPDGPRSYVHIPLPEDAAALFRVRLLAGQKDEKVNDLVEQIFKNPQRYGFSADLLKSLGKDKNFARFFLKQWLMNTDGNLTAETGAM